MWLFRTSVDDSALGAGSALTQEHRQSTTFRANDGRDGSLCCRHLPNTFSMPAIVFRAMHIKPCCSTVVIGAPCDLRVAHFERFGIAYFGSSHFRRLCQRGDRSKMVQCVSGAPAAARQHRSGLSIPRRSRGSHWACWRDMLDRAMRNQFGLKEYVRS